MNRSAKILYHPRFGQPKVENPVIRGMKKGCLSFQVAYRQRRSRQPTPLTAPTAPIMTTEQAAQKAIERWAGTIRDHLLWIETALKLVELDKKVSK